MCGPSRAFWTCVFLFVFHLTSAVPVLADPHYFRTIERQTKAAQARFLKKQLALSDFSERPSVSVRGYDFDLNVLPSEARLTGTVTIEFSAKSALDRVVLDSVDLNIQKVWFTNAVGVRSESRFETMAGKLDVQFPVSVSAETDFALTIAYSVTGDKLDGRATPVEKGLFFVNGDELRDDVDASVYTTVQPSLARTWFPGLDDPSMKASRMRMRVTVPMKWKALSNGALTRTYSRDGNTTTFEWEHVFPIPTYLISLAAGPYELIEERWRNLPVQYYVPKRLEEKARYDFGRTPEMLEHFSDLWTPYPFEKYAMSVVSHYNTAMEHTTATTMGDVLVSGEREDEAIVAHELAHHWWGNVVTPAHWNDLWLSEGFATYSEALMTEKFDGADVALESLLWNRKAYFKFDKKGTAAVVDPAIEPDEKFTEAVYEKGSWILHMLRQQLGDVLFFEAMRRYFDEFAFSSATTEGMKAVFERVSRQELDHFFQQWVYGKGYPRVLVDWTFDRATRKLSVNFTQETSFEMPMEVLVAQRALDGRLKFHSMRHQVKKDGSVLEFALSDELSEPVGVLVDPDHKLLRKLIVRRSQAELLFWLELNHDQFKKRPWLTRFNVLEEIPKDMLTTELVHAVVRTLADESSVRVRARLMEVLTHARRLKGFTDEDFHTFQKVIAKGLDDEEPDVRVAAGIAAREYLSPTLSELLATRLTKEESPRVKAELVKALATAKHPRAFGLLFAELQKSREFASHLQFAEALLESFGRLGDRRGAAVLMSQLDGHNPFLRRAALEGLGLLRMPETFETITAILKSTQHSIPLRISSAKALANHGGLVSTRVLQEQLKVETNKDLRKAITDALKRLSEKQDYRRISMVR